MISGNLCKFSRVFREEIASINKRRAAAIPPRAPINLENEPVPKDDGEPALRPTSDSQVVGLALSGGGIRSAAVCLGALQALDQTGVLPRVDYLSTVSGGGYIGASLSTGLHETHGVFPFASRLAEDEVPAMQHLRDHSNYLFPRGEFALLHNVAIFTRGLISNFILIMPFLLFFAAVTSFANPSAETLSQPNVFGLRVMNIFSFKHFVVTAYLALALLAAIIIWSWARSRSGALDETEIPNRWTGWIGWLVALVAFAGFCELQPFILHEMFAETRTGRGFFAILSDLVHGAAAALAPVAAAVAILARKLGEFVKSGIESSSKKDQFLAYAGKALIYVAALFVPLLLWVIYLQFSYWGVCFGTHGCTVPSLIAMGAGRMPGDVVGLYIGIAILFLVISMFLRPNANSLHPLYRDRLSKAFLFTPLDVAPPDGLPPLRLKLSELSEEYGPYHLINAALNVQTSKAANRRGRNADFFLFSRNFIGSKSTEYIRTASMEAVTPGLDLGTAMAVSGAAASSEMGAETIKPLTPTLAMLNIRLGYWLRNPKRVGDRLGWNRWANFYFVLEMLGLLNEKWKSIYLTDGGHIENLGLYALLKRRCKVNIVVDAEADSQMGFGSFNTLERYARIDLGVRIDLPWQPISDMTKATTQAIAKDGKARKEQGPHCAIGQIKYPDNRTGILVYIKASLTGDENDYVFQYKNRYSDFPHETTLDQLFTEEQFEVYRALGFHAAFNLFDGWDAFAHLDPEKYPGVADDLNLLDQLFPRQEAAQPGVMNFADRLKGPTQKDRPAQA
jgi:hypothetical protein